MSDVTDRYEAVAEAIGHDWRGVDEDGLRFCDKCSDPLADVWVQWPCDVVKERVS